MQGSGVEQAAVVTPAKAVPSINDVLLTNCNLTGPNKVQGVQGANDINLLQLTRTNSILTRSKSQDKVQLLK